MSLQSNLFNVADPFDLLSWLIEQGDEANKDTNESFHAMGKEVIFLLLNRSGIPCDNVQRVVNRLNFNAFSSLKMYKRTSMEISKREQLKAITFDLLCIIDFKYAIVLIRSDRNPVHKIGIQEIIHESLGFKITEDHIGTVVMRKEASPTQSQDHGNSSFNEIIELALSFNDEDSIIRAYNSFLDEKERKTTKAYWDKPKQDWSDADEKAFLNEIAKNDDNWKFNDDGDWLEYNCKPISIVLIINMVYFCLNEHVGDEERISYRLKTHLEAHKLGAFTLFDQVNKQFHMANGVPIKNLGSLNVIAILARPMPLNMDLIHKLHGINPDPVQIANFIKFMGIIEYRSFINDRIDMNRTMNNLAALISITKAFTC